MSRDWARSGSVFLASVAALISLPGVVSAGGLARPNLISARGVGMGGATVATTADATALHFNPAGLSAVTGTEVLVGGELIIAPRTYVPIDADGNRGDAQSPQTPVVPLPSLGVATRLRQDGVPTPLTFALGAWNTFGGELRYEPFENENIPALDYNRDAVFEVVAGASYRANDVLSVGAALRVGYGLFDIEATAKPLDTIIHASGIGVGATLGALLTPIARPVFGSCLPDRAHRHDQGRRTDHPATGRARRGHGAHPDLARCAGPGPGLSGIPPPSFGRTGGLDRLVSLRRPWRSDSPVRVRWTRSLTSIGATPLAYTWARRWR